MLDRFSKPVDAMGGVVADAILKILGTHDADTLRTMIRESVQNSLDAKLKNQTPTYRIHPRTLTKAQQSALTCEIVGENVEEKGLKKRIAALSKGKLRVIEIEDHGTSGLAGPDRADRAAKPNHWASFVLNIGQDVNHIEGGGTYGFGKSSLYAASRASLVCIYSRTRDEKKRLCNRFIAAALSPGFSDAGGRLYSGRHWWGLKENKPERASPVLDKDADKAAKSLGMRIRQGDDTGTSILIIDPSMKGGENELANTRELASVLHEALLVHCWPLMHPEEKPKMRFEIWCEGEQIPNIALKNAHPFNKFTECLDRARSKTTEDEEDLHIVRRRAGRWKNRILGRLSWEKFMTGLDKNVDLGVPHGWSEIERFFGTNDTQVHHTALMRPVDLVVDYETCHAPAFHKLSYAAVFRVDAAEKIERAFAASEPPAHDRWNPESGTEQGRAVKDAVRQYEKRLAKEFPDMKSGANDSDSTSSILGKLANKLGESLSVTAGQSARATKSKPPKANRNQQARKKEDGGRIGDLLQTDISESDREGWRSQTIEFLVTPTEEGKIDVRVGLGYARDDGGVDKPDGNDFTEAPPFVKSATIEEPEKSDLKVDGSSSPVFRIQSAKQCRCSIVVEHPEDRVLHVSATVEGAH